MASRGKLMVAMCLKTKEPADEIIENEVDEEGSMITDFSSDDSIADPNFEIGDSNNHKHVDSESDSDEAEIIETEAQEKLLNVGDTAAVVDSNVLQPVVTKRRHKENLKYNRLTNEQKVARDKMKHPMKRSCSEKCKRKCRALFTEEDRLEIWEKFWSLQYFLRRKWLAKNVQIVSINRRTVAAKNMNEGGYLKGDSRKFFFPKDNRSVSVCRTYFLNTLGYSNDSVITELCAAMKREPMLSAVKENRGATANSIRKRDRSLIMDHINGYKPSVSHYRRHNAPNIKYLPRELTVKAMFQDFNIKHPEFCKIELYRQTLKSMHISLCMPKSDACVDCLSYKMSQTEHEDNIQPAFANEEEWNLHKTKASKATEKYHQDSLLPDDENVRIFSMDLQKVILIPNMPSVKDSYFLSRLVAFNLTFCSLKKNPVFKNYCSMWHEGVGGRDGHNIVDAIFRVFEEERDVKEFIIWTDNCTGQNKNWILYTSLVYLVNEEGVGPDSVTLRYLTKGHTHMSADGIHGNIERKIAQIRDIHDYDDLKEAVRCSRKNVHVLDVTVFHKWEKKKRQVRKNSKTTEVVDPLHGFLLNPVVEARFRKGTQCLEYKTDFDQPEYTSLDFLQKKFNLKKNMPPVTLPKRGIKLGKKQLIIEVLGHLMPPNRLQFWNNLPESDTALDLIEDFDVVNVEEAST